MLNCLPKTKEGNKPMSKGNILVLEDESIIRDVIDEILIKEGYTIVTASDGEEGYNRVKENHFDLIITDVKMPKINGLEFIKKIREDFSIDTPVVVITGHGTIDTAIESMRYGAQGFVLKPFTPKELVETVGHAIYKSQLIKENIKLKAILPLFEINKKILSELNIDKLIEIITKEASAYIMAEMTSLMLMDKEKGTLILKASTDKDIKSGETKKIAGEEIADMVAKTMTPLLLNEKTSTTPFIKGISGIKSALSIPIIVKGMLTGVLNFFKINSEQPFTNSDMEFVSVLCGQAGIAIENAQLYEKVANSYMEIIATLANAIEARDKYTAGHSIRMAEYCCSIAIKLGTPPIEVENIYKAALLHDIGKIGIPDNILLKMGPLSIDEYKTIKNHPDIGVKIICNLPDVANICNIIRHHHERFDGYGYPDSLKGEEIPIGSRILFIADTFEAMTNLRPYREALSVAKAIDELKNCAGTQFDPKVVDTFINILKEKKISHESTKNVKSKGPHAKTKS